MTLILRWQALAPQVRLRWRGPTEAMIEAISANPASPVAAIIGPRGPAGSGGSGGVNWVDGETPSGVMNGVNRVFALVHAPLWLALVWNGMVQTEGVDFTRSGADITLLRDGPMADDVLSAFYTWE